VSGLRHDYCVLQSVNAIASLLSGRSRPVCWLTDWVWLTVLFCSSGESTTFAAKAKSPVSIAGCKQSLSTSELWTFCLHLCATARRGLLKRRSKCVHLFNSLNNRTNGRRSVRTLTATSVGYNQGSSKSLGYNYEPPWIPQPFIEFPIPQR